MLQKILCSTAVAIACMPAVAAPVSFQNGRIQQSLVFGDKVFSDIACVSVEIDCDTLTAEAISSDGHSAISFAGAMNVSAGNLLDVQFFYTVQTSDNADRIIGLTGSIVGTSTDDTFGSVAESVFDPEDSNALVGFISQTMGLDEADPAFEADDLNLSAAFNILTIETSLFLDASSAPDGGGISVSAIVQGFEQIPGTPASEPVTLTLLPAALAALGFARRRPRRSEATAG